MRCPNCGAIANTLLVDTEDKLWYQCTRPLRRLEANIKENRVSFRDKSELCLTVIDPSGKALPYTDNHGRRSPNPFVAYVTNGKVETVKLFSGIS